MVEKQAVIADLTDSANSSCTRDKDILIDELTRRVKLLEEALQAKDGELLARQEELEVQSEELEVQNDELRTSNDEMETAARSLQKTEAHLLRAQNLAHIGSWEWDIKTGKQVWSEERYRIFGLTPGEIEPGYAVSLSFIHSDDRQKAEAALAAAVSGIKPFEMEYRIVRKDRTIRYLHSVGSIDYDANGEPVTMHGFAQDITERKNAEAELRRLSLAVEQSPASVMITDTNGTIEYVNSKFIRLTGYSKEEILGQNPSFLKSEETPYAVYRGRWNTILSGKEWRGEFRNRKKNGEPYWESALIAPAKDANGKITHFVAIKEDITERKQVEEKLRLSELRYRSLFKNMPDGFAYCKMIYDDQGNAVDFVFLEVNDALMRIMHTDKIAGKKASEGMPGLKVSHPELLEIFGLVALTGSGERCEIELKPLTSWLSISVYSTEKGHFTTIFENITERKLSERQIKASLKEKDVLLKEVNHRVKNNLQIISSLLNLQSEYITDKKDLAMFNEAQNRVKTMALIHEMLYKSKDLSQIYVADYIRGLTTNLYKSYRVDNNSITLKMGIQEISLDIDSIVPLGLIINELVTNALKYAFPDNRRGEITVSLTRTGNAITLIISDNGIGLPKNFDIHKINSLGLDLVQSLTSQLNGTLDLSNSNGTSMKITFEEPL